LNICKFNKELLIIYNKLIKLTCISVSHYIRDKYQQKSIAEYQKSYRCPWLVNYDLIDTAEVGTHLLLQLK
jgi:hypothetical protein